MRKMIKSSKTPKNEDSKQDEDYELESQSFNQPLNLSDRPLGQNKFDLEDDPEQFQREQEENLKEVEDVPMNKRAMAETLSQIFDEDIIKHILSTKWQQRVKGFEMANGYTLAVLQKADDIIAVQNLIFSVIQEGLMDKVSDLVIEF